MLLGNPVNGREWTTVDVERADILRAQLGTALTVTQRSQYLAARSEDLDRAVRKIETEATQRRLALETALRATQAEAQSASTRLASLAKLQEEIAAQRGTEETRWQQQLQAMAEERARLEAHCAINRRKWRDGAAQQIGSAADRSTATSGRAGRSTSGLINDRAQRDVCGSTRSSM